MAIRSGNVNLSSDPIPKATSGKMMPTTSVTASGSANSSIDTEASPMPPFNPMASSKYKLSVMLSDSGIRKFDLPRAAITPVTNRSTGALVNKNVNSSMISS